MYGVEKDTSDCIARTAALGLPPTSCYVTSVGRNHCRTASWAIGGLLIVGGAGTWAAGRLTAFILGGIGLQCST